MKNLTLAEVVTNPIVIYRSPTNKDYKDSNIYIKNKSDHYIIFKVKLNHPNLYVASPPYGYMKPLEKGQFSLKHLDKEESHNNPDICLIEFYKSAKAITSNEDANLMVSQKIVKDKESIQIKIVIKEEEIGVVKEEVTEEEFKKAEGDLDKEIEVFTQGNDYLRNKIKQKENEIEMIKKQIENVKVNKSLKIGKDKAIKAENDETLEKNKEKSLSLTIVMLAVLLAFTIGGFFKNLF